MKVWSINRFTSLMLSNELHPPMERILSVKQPSHCPYLHPSSWQKTVDEHYCYWTVSRDRCGESGLKPAPDLTGLCLFSEELQVNHSTQDGQLH